MMQIRVKEAPIVKFRADLPGWIEPLGKAFIEIDGRPAGRCNQAFMAGREQVDLARRIREAGLATDGADAVKAKDAAGVEYGAEWVAMIYDTCVTAWRTNLVDDTTGKPLTCDRDTFLALCGVRISEIANAILEFQTEALKAGEAVIADTEATIKN